MADHEVLVIGHRNPDTDAICSAIAYAEFKRRTGLTTAEAARCGDITDRVGFVLNSFGAEPPRLVLDVYPRIRDVMEASVIHVRPDATLREALSVMDECNIRVLPILRHDRTCFGFASVFKMNKFLCPPPDRLSEVRRVCASIQNLARTLGGRVLVSSGPEHEREFTLMVASMQLESFKQRLAALDPQHLLVIVGDRVRIQKMALEARVAVLIVSGNNDVPPELIEAAQQAGVSLLVSPHDSATTALLCRAAITVEHMVHEQFLSFQDDELLEEVQAMATASHFHVFPVLDSEKQTIGILSKSDFLKKPDRKLILVDHNELSQAVPGADQVEILEIIDHHRLGALTTTQPILFRNEPVGSTSTIVAECFFRNQVELSKNLAGLLLAGLVSDTLNLTSPTSTERDGQILRRLEKISGVNAGSFLEKLFASGSVLTSSPPDEAILADCKEFAEQGQTFSAAQIEEVGFETFWKRKDELFEALERHRARKKYFFAVLLVTDVSRKSSLMLVAGPPALQRTIDQPLVQPGVFEMPGFVSRKKQLLPYLADCLKKLGTVRVTAEPVTMV